MEQYKQYYQFILSKYGTKRNQDIDNYFIQNNNQNSILSQKIDTIREEFLNLEVYTIDPEGCIDADDGFSIQFIDNKMYLIIHIADPTHYIDYNSELWKDIERRVLTHYPSNYDPIHMMPDEIMKKASLNEGIKNAISIFYEIDQTSFLPISKKIKFTKLLLKKENNLSYKQASEIENYAIDIALKISKNLKNERSKVTIGTKLSEVNLLIPKFKNKEICFEEFNKKIKDMKEMISEFAILTNSFIGEFIKNNLDNNGIFRTCQANISPNENLNGEKLLEKIINEGVSADYNSNNKSHDLVGTNIYCHFTSPIRRLADCICHYLIKFYFTNTNIIWSKEQLKNYALLCFNKTKKEKKIQYSDHKFRLVQLIKKLLPENNIHIEFKITNYTGMFLNIMIYKLLVNDNEYTINLSYTLRVFSDKYFSLISKIDKIKINNVNPIGKFDQGSIVDLDNHIKKLISENNEIQI